MICRTLWGLLLVDRDLYISDHSLDVILKYEPGLSEVDVFVGSGSGEKTTVGFRGSAKPLDRWMILAIGMVFEDFAILEDPKGIKQSLDESIINGDWWEDNWI